MRHLPLFTALLLALSSTAQAESFTYRGQLDDGGAPAEGSYRLKLSLYADAQGKQPLAAPVLLDAVPVKEGRFAVAVDFPDLPAFVQSGWLEAAVMGEGEGDFWPLPEKQAVSLKAQVCPESWALAGNASTNAGVNFLGTTDSQPLVLRTGNVQSLRIEPSTELFNGLPNTSNVIAGSHANSVTVGVRGAAIAGGGLPSGDSALLHADEGPNRVTDDFGTVGGGFNNRAGDDAGDATDNAYATVAGGVKNTAAAYLSSVGGGFQNNATGIYGAISGGYANSVTNTLGVIGGGQANIAGGAGSTVGGGYLNSARATYATVAGGETNSAAGYASSVPGGNDNCAGGSYSWAGGRSAKVRPAVHPGDNGPCSGLPDYPGGNGDAGTFVWADSQEGNFVSTGPNRFLVRAQNGALITGGGTNNTQGNRLRVDGTLRVDVMGVAGSTDLCRNASNQIASCSSSARYKSQIEDLDLGLATLQRLRPVSYHWIDTGEADLGFVAEEVAAIDERLITRNDKGEVEGVKYERLTALLARALEEAQAQNADALARLQSENSALRNELAALRTQQTTELTALREQLADLRALLLPAVAVGGR